MPSCALADAITAFVGSAAFLDSTAAIRLPDDCAWDSTLGVDSMVAAGLATGAAGAGSEGQSTNGTTGNSLNHSLESMSTNQA